MVCSTGLRAGLADKKAVPLAEARQLFLSKAVVFVDVRSAREYRSESLAGAAHAALLAVPSGVPLGAVDAVLAQPAKRDLLPFNTSFETDLRRALGAEAKSTAALLFCSNGQRSRQAVELLLEEGYDEVRWMAGGLSGWLDVFTPRGLPRKRVVAGVFRDTSSRAIWTDSAEEDTVLQAAGGNTRDLPCPP